MSWVEVDGAGWSWVELDGAGWSWVHGLVIAVLRRIKPVMCMLPCVYVITRIKRRRL